MSYRYDQDEDHHRYAGAITGDFTMELWTQFNSVLSTYISLLWMGADDAYTADLYQRGILIVTGNDPDTIEIWARASDAARITTASGTLVTTRPIHIALTGNTGNNQALELFIDGVSAGTGTTGAQSTYEAAWVIVGNDNQFDAFDPDTNFSTGSLQHVVISNRIKTVEEIRAGMFDFLVAAQESWAAWPLYDANGLIDHSGNGRDLTAQGTPTVDSGVAAWPAAYDGFYGYNGWMTSAAAAGGFQAAWARNSNVLLGPI